MDPNQAELFQGWNPPTPLLEPLHWPVANAGEPVVVPLDFYAVVGGPYRSAVDRWLKNGWPILWQVSETAQESEMLMLAIGDAVDEIQAIATFAEDLEIESLSRRDEWHLWAKALFPNLCRELGEDEFFAWISSFAKENPSVIETPWLGFSYFSGTIRQAALLEAKDEKTAPRDAAAGETTGPARRSEIKFRLAEETALEWARFQALYSPMDETSEAASLEGHELLVNPAAQIVPLQKKGEMRHLLRRRRSHWQIIEGELDWMQASLIDALRESPRVTRAQLLKEIQNDMRQVETLPGPLDGSWDDKLDDLIDQELVLCANRGLVH